MQALTATRPSDFWLLAVAANSDTIDESTTSPHALSLFTDVQPVDEFVDCDQFNETVSLRPFDYPALEAMLCSLVRQGNAARTEDDSPSPASNGVSEAPLGVQMGGTALRPTAANVRGFQ